MGSLEDLSCSLCNHLWAVRYLVSCRSFNICIKELAYNFVETCISGGRGSLWWNICCQLSNFPTLLNHPAMVYINFIKPFLLSSRLQQTPALSKLVNDLFPEIHKKNKNNHRGLSQVSWCQALINFLTSVVSLFLFSLLL